MSLSNNIEYYQVNCDVAMTLSHEQYLMTGNIKPTLATYENREDTSALTPSNIESQHPLC